MGHEPKEFLCATAHYEHELSQLKMEMTGLRSALARSEAMLLERSKLDLVGAVTARAHSAPIGASGEKLTPRQREIMALVLDGHPSKNIAVDLGISQRTVENHRAAIMKKTRSKSLPALGRFGLMVH